MGLVRTLDGFTVTLPGHWLIDVLLRLVRVCSAGACFVIGEVLAIMLCVLTAVPSVWLV